QVRLKPARCVQFDTDRYYGSAGTTPNFVVKAMKYLPPSGAPAHLVPQDDGDVTRIRDAKSLSSADIDQFKAIADLFANDPIDLIEKIEAFQKYATHKSIARFLTKYEIFKM